MVDPDSPVSRSAVYGHCMGNRSDCSPAPRPLPSVCAQMFVMFPVEDGIRVANHVLAVMVVRLEPSGFTPMSFEGTGFVIAPGMLVTCWHCVGAPYRKVRGMRRSSNWKAVRVIAQCF